MIRVIQSSSHHIVRSALALLLLLPFAARGVDVAGTVNDASGKPVSGATVWLTQDRQPRHSETDANGGFTFPNVAAKPADLVARKEGLAGSTLPGLRFLNEKVA